MSYYGLLQLVGGAILATGYIPQIRQLLSTRKADDINLWFFCQMVLGVTCMEVYAVHLYTATGEGFFLATNSVALAMASTVVALKLRYSQTAPREGDGSG